MDQRWVHRTAFILAGLCFVGSLLLYLAGLDTRPTGRCADADWFCFDLDFSYFFFTLGWIFVAGGLVLLALGVVFFVHARGRRGRPTATRNQDSN